MPKAFKGLPKAKRILLKTRLAVYVTIFAMVGGAILLLSHAAPNPNLPGDLNGDNKVDGADLSFLVANYGTTNSAADINNDGAVDALDLSILLGHFGQTYTSSSPTFASETAYTNTPPAFTVKRTVTFTDRTSLNNAVANALPGDLIKPASTPLTISAAPSSGGVLNISTRLTSLAQLDLRGVTINDTFSNGTGGHPAVYMTNPSYWYIEGGNITNPTGGGCISWFAGQHITWWHFVAHDCAQGGMGVFTSTSAYSFGGPIQNNDIEGELYHTALVPSFDNHQEKCTGLHGMNLADNNQFDISGNRIALNDHDEACNGAGIEFGTSNSSPLPTSNTIILECTNFTFISTIQTGGNCFQTWGYGVLNTDVKYLVASNITGHAYHANDGSMFGSGQTGKLTTDKVEYGRATTFNTNTRYSGDPAFSTFDGTIFMDVACASPATPCIGVVP